MVSSLVTDVLGQISVQHETLDDKQHFFFAYFVLIFKKTGFGNYLEKKNSTNESEFWTQSSALPHQNTGFKASVGSNVNHQSLISQIWSCSLQETFPTVQFQI